MKRPEPKKAQFTMYLLLLVGALLIMFMLRQCSSKGGSLFGGSRAGGDTLNVAIDYSPMSMYRYGDTIGGLSYDIIRAISAENGIPLKFHPIVSLSDALARLDSGYYDLIVADIPSTAEYKQTYLLTEPVYTDRSILVQRADSGRVRSQLDLARKTVRVVGGSPVVERIRNLGQEIGDTIYIVEDSVYGAEQLVMLVATGEIDYAVVSEGVARRVAEDYRNLDLGTNISFTQFQSWIASRRRPDLKTRLDSLIIRFTQSPAYPALLERY